MVQRPQRRVCAVDAQLPQPMGAGFGHTPSLQPRRDLCHAAPPAGQPLTSCWGWCWSLACARTCRSRPSCAWCWARCCPSGEAARGVPSVAIADWWSRIPVTRAMPSAAAGLWLPLGRPGPPRWTCSPAWMCSWPWPRLICCLGWPPAALPPARGWPAQQVRMLQGLRY